MQWQAGKRHNSNEQGVITETNIYTKYWMEGYIYLPTHTSKTGEKLPNMAGKLYMQSCLKPLNYYINPLTGMKGY